MSKNWAKIDVNYLTNPKVRAASRQHKMAPLVHLEAILYSADHMTDGKADIETILWNTRAPQTALKACIEAGLLTQVDRETVQVHDYDRHQTPAREIEETREARSRAGKAGAKARWSKPDSKPDSKSHSKSHSNRIANRIDTAMPRREENRKELEIEKREREEAPALAPEISTLINELSRVLTDSRVPHTVTEEWEPAMSDLVARRGAEPVREAIAYIGTDPFWVTTVIHPGRLAKNWETIQAQSRRKKISSASEPEEETVPREEPDEYPPGLLTDQERDLWLQTWRKHRARGLSPYDSSLSACAELNIAPVIDMKERLA